MLGRIHTEATKQKMSASQKGKVPSVETKQKMSEAAKDRSVEVRRKLSEAAKGRVLSEESKQKIRVANLGRKHSVETMRKLFKAQSNRSPEWRRRMSEAHRGKVLSIEHRQKLSKAGMARTGERSGNWKGGISFEPYPSKFNRVLKDRIKNRDGYCCQNPECWGNTNKLNIHHIDYDKTNCLESNLITLCVSCNARVNYHRRFWQFVLQPLAA